jgi:TonB family protein
MENIPRFNGGLTEEWFESGQLQKRYFYKTAVSLHGEVFTYHENGLQKRKEIYDDGVLLKGQTFNDNGMEVPYTDFIIPASFPGGNNAMMGYLLKNIKYPSKLLKNGISGTVNIKFMIDIDGSLKDVSVATSVHELLDKEALRVVKKMPEWTPRIFDGELVPSYFILPVTFKLD